MNEVEKKEINEMARLTCAYSAHIYNDCKDCCHNPCAHKYNAEALYNAGYRKLPDGATVLLVGKYNQALDEKTIEYFIKHNEQIRKETAKEILNELIDSSNKITFFDCRMALGLDNLAKQYGVEVEE